MQNLLSSTLLSKSVKIESNIQLFADDCIIYRKINGSSDIDKLQKDLNKLWEWALENEMKINPGKSKTASQRLG
jgi:hypothetical protein